MADLGREWGLRLAGTLRKWCDQYAYYPRNKLATELGIGAAQWAVIITGNSVVEKADSTVYARLFHRTGLEEADPRTIPSRKLRLPRGGFTEIERAWSEEDWQRWLRAQPRSEVREIAPAAVASAEEKPTAAPPGAQQSVGMLVGTFADRLIGVLGAQLGREIAPLLAEQVTARVVEEVRLALRPEPHEEFKGAKASSESSREIDQIAQQLYAALQQVFLAGPEVRDALMRRYGKSLARLLPAIEVLTRPRNEREEGIRTMQEVKL